ncbi:MAG: hypothetical protein IPK44_02060 [Candidatus Accumulibacter sp.]|uniref:hypothetical protein n=1 Tax=Accumulibacter sp. TaxID=2053492 RepID=UPI00258B9812|nr:hypothetical protein [Accumulibacter sp.]MBK8113386.1 hypothetical protein [Accumulibacter sp.]
MDDSKGFVVSVGSCGPFESGDMEAAESAFDALASENESLQIEVRLLKREIRTLLDTIRCASEVLEKLTEERK